MTEELKDLIEKIQAEGVQAAEEKARQIEEEARHQASSILEKAKRDAERIVNEAKERISKMEESSQLALKQAGRDTLINLRNEINALLDKVIKSAIQEALTAQEMIKIINTLIKDYAAKHKEGIEILIKKEDREKIEQGLFSALSEEVKKGVTLKACDEVSAGFLISFDQGKSHFDFTDKALADYLGKYLKLKLAAILKESPERV